MKRIITLMLIAGICLGGGSGFLAAEDLWEYEDSFVQDLEATTLSPEMSGQGGIVRSLKEQEFANSEVLWSESLITELVPASTGWLVIPCRCDKDCQPEKPKPGVIYTCSDGTCAEYTQTTTVIRTRTRGR